MMRSNRTRPVALKAREPTSWYRIDNRADVAEIFLYEEIGQWGIGAADFVKDLRDVTSGEINLHINSPGGEVHDGLAIYNALRTHKAKVNVSIDGVAASAASFVAMAGDSVTVARNAQVMIHEAHAVCVGNAQDMTRCAELLAMCSDNIADIYAQRAGGTVASWREAMRRETWFTADEAVKAGLADEVTGQANSRNTWDLSVFNYAGRDSAPDPFLAFGLEMVATTAPEPGPESYFTGEQSPESVALTQEMADRMNAAVQAAVPDPPPPAAPTADPPTEAGFLMPDVIASIRELHEVRYDPATLFAAVNLGICDVPAPDPPRPQAPADEPLVAIDLPAVRRALREAAL